MQQALETFFILWYNDDGTLITLLPSAQPIKQVKLKWSFDTAFMKTVLPDTWGIALADLQWQSLPLPHPAQWYFAAFDGIYTHGFSVKTGATAFAPGRSIPTARRRAVR